MMLDIGGFETLIEYLIATPIYGYISKPFSNEKFSLKENFQA